MYKNSAVKLISKFLTTHGIQPLCLSTEKSVQIIAKYSIKYHGVNWPHLILVNNIIPNYQNLKRDETSHSYGFLIRKLDSENTHVSSRESSRRRCKAVSLLIMKQQLKQTRMVGEGSVLWLVHINARLTLNEQWKSMTMISNTWPLPVRPSKKKRGLGLGLQ